MKPMMGEATSGMIILETTTFHCTAPRPRDAPVAPIKPPIRACDELLGRPRYQVSRFQMMAPSSAARIILSVTLDGDTTPLPIVAATCRVVNAPRKFMAAERRIAARGESA